MEAGADTAAWGQSEREGPGLGHFVHWQEVPASTSPSSHLADQPLLVCVPDDI